MLPKSLLVTANLLSMIVWFCPNVCCNISVNLTADTLGYETFLTNPLTTTGLDMDKNDETINSLLRSKPKKTESKAKKPKPNQDGHILASVEDYEKAAKKILPEMPLVYYNGGADLKITLAENVLAFRRLLIRPRLLVGVSERNLSTNILGGKVDFPLGVDPMALQKMASPAGEIATAKAAAAAGTIFILSTMASTKIEDIAKAVPNGRKWMQIYMFTQRSLTVNLVRRAEENGFEALVVTVDAPISGHRPDMYRQHSNLRNWTLGNFGEEMIDTFRVLGRPLNGEDVGTEAIYDASLTWKDMQWLKSITKLPVIVKGVLNADDAEKVIEYGLDGVFVSNHGGRQLDDVEPTIDALPEIVHRLQGRCPVMIDGGVRSGSDVFKALALGADMVFAGRPFLWGNAVNGESGVSHILDIMKAEFDSTMALAGVRSVEEITDAYIKRRQCHVTFTY